jgi:spermidine/putrescine transport system permease protein
MTRRAQTASWLFVAAMMIFLFAPVLVVVAFSFNSTPSTSLPLEGLSLRWYEQVFDDPLYVEALVNSALAAIGTAVTSVVIGTAAAIGLARRRSRVTGALSAVILAPLMLPGLFIGVALLSFASRVGFDLSLLTVIAGHVVITLPLVVLIVSARLAQLDWEVVEAARDLGASGPAAFRRVVLPAILPAVIGAGLMALAWSADELIITLFTNGGDTTVPVLVLGLARRELDPSINAVASLILASTVIATVVAMRFVSPKDVVG